MNRQLRNNGIVSCYHVFGPKQIYTDTFILIRLYRYVYTDTFIPICLYRYVYTDTFMPIRLY